MYKLIIFNSDKNQTYDISSISHTITHTTSILGHPGKLTFLTEKDKSNKIKLSVGNLVTFTVSENNYNYSIFKGYIFSIGVDSTDAYRIVAYDQTRYLRNKDTILVSDKDNGPMSVVDLFNKICDVNGISQSNRESKIINCNYKLLPHLYQNESYFHILYNSFVEHLTHSTEKQFFFIKDNFGKLQLNEISLCKTKYIIGNYSNLKDYRCQFDINTNTFNQITILKNDKDKGISSSIVKKDDKNISTYGTLNKLVRRDIETIAQIENFSKLELDLLNKINQSVTLNAIGIPDLNAGDGFIFRLSKLGKKDIWMFILSATHNYEADSHSMSLDVSGFFNDVKVDKQPIETVIYEVIRGELGNGQDRKNELKRRGYSQTEIENIQTKINMLYNQGKQCLNGKWGKVIKQNGEYQFTSFVEENLKTLNIEPDLFRLVLSTM